MPTPRFGNSWGRNIKTERYNRDVYVYVKIPTFGRMLIFHDFPIQQSGILSSEFFSDKSKIDY